MHKLINNGYKEKIDVLIINVKTKNSSLWYQIGKRYFFLSFFFFSIIYRTGSEDTK